MGVIKKNTIRKIQKKKGIPAIVITKTKHFGDDILFKEKLQEANLVLSQTSFLPR
jgi:hypothetical protein